ncbi:MAG: hypothetical protein AB7I36_10890 [Rhodospirillaceae bacterium]
MRTITPTWTLFAMLGLAACEAPHPPPPPPPAARLGVTLTESPPGADTMNKAKEAVTRQ